MGSQERNYSVCTVKPVTPSTSFTTRRPRSHEPISRMVLALLVFLQVSRISIFTICDTQRRLGLRTPGPTHERSWRYSAIDAFKHPRVTLTPLTRVCDALWKRLRNGKRVPTQKSPQ